MTGLARLLDCAPEDILFANLAYDISSCLTGPGCSTFVAPTPHGPLHARNLDRSFHGGLLRQLITAFTLPSRHGEYQAVSWPGLFGVLTGMAPGRFSVSVNYVSNVTGLGAALIEGVSLLRRVLAGNMPVTWAVRDALESRKTFKAAVKYLSEVPSLAPVLFAVAGTDNDERVVIERQPDEADLRWPDDEGVLALTNHRVGQEDRSDNEDSVGRFAFLEGRLTYRQPDAAVAALRLLSSDVLFQDDDDYKTQHQVVMEPRAGRLTVRARGRGTRVARVGQ